MSNFDNLMSQLTGFDHAVRLSNELEAPALLLVDHVGTDDVIELFRRVAAGEDVTDDFLRRFAEAMTAADVECVAIMMPTAYKLLAKYPHLVERHRATPVVKEFTREG